jgi:hypothetical protein
MARRFPAPWTVEALDGCSLSGFKVIDANRQSLAYVYWREAKDAAYIAGVLTEDEARRIASNIAKLPVLPGKVRPNDSLQAEMNLSDELRRHHAQGRAIR